MADIRIIEKPEYISFDDIHDLLYKAHQINREKGFNVKTAEMSGSELAHHLEPEGKCFVAMDGDKLVGTTSYRIRERNYWCAKGKVADRVLAGVLPEYKGQGISSKLFQIVLENAKAGGLRYVESSTAEENEIVQKINLKDGYKYIDFRSTKADHYTVVMLQWIDGCPYAAWKIKARFLLKKYYIKIRYKPGRIKRFGV